MSAKGRYLAPLLDRLVDDASAAGPETVPMRNVSAETYRRIIVRDVLWLLNTRAAGRTWLEGSGAPDVMDYGLPDSGTVLVESEADMKALARRVGQAIRAFEPRLADVRVRVVKLPPRSYTVPLRGGAAGELPFANPRLGQGAQVDFSGQDAAGRRFRGGMMISARVVGMPRREPLAFLLGYDAGDGTLAVVEVDDDQG
jgi:type VI secretion system lysozyme-like protein